MLTMKRLLRVFDNRYTVELAGKDRGGEQGEEDAEQVIRDVANVCYMHSPIIPHPRKPGFFLESDFLVYTRGVLFCVEIKNYRGRVYYPARTHIVHVKKSWFIFKWTVARTVVDGYDYSTIIQEKRGYNGEGLTTRDQPNPLPKTQHIVEDFQRFLPAISKDFQGIPIYPVVAFSEKTDISAIYDFKAGILHVPELPTFFASHGHASSNKVQLQRIQQAFELLPTWDRVWTTANEMIYGTFTDQDFCFQDTNNHSYKIPYAQLQAIEFKRSDTFSAYDEIVISYTNGKDKAFRCTGGELYLNRFQGERQVHKFRNLTKLVVGIANKKF